MKLSGLACLLLCIVAMSVGAMDPNELQQSKDLQADNEHLQRELATHQEDVGEGTSSQNTDGTSAHSGLIHEHSATTAAGVASAMQNCTFYHVVEHLQLTQKKDMFTLVRPVNDPKTVTNVTLDVAIYAILDVQEIGQKFTSYLWTLTAWQNDFIQWNPKQFCDIESVAVPLNALWKPDIIIQDMIDKDKSTPSPYLTVWHNGMVWHRNDQVVVSTCRIKAYKFPFDMQTCDLSFRSAMYSDSAINLTPIGNSNETTQWSLEALRTQYEWIFINLTITEKKEDFFNKQDVITYSILMKRRWKLYVVNYLLPLLFFLFLDLASFLISDTGDKLGFKITVLLAVTVMQLLFNEILPSSSDRIPIIAVFCAGIFSLMLLSLLESLVILYLINKDEKQEQAEVDPYSRLKDVISLSHSAIPSNSTLEKAHLSDHFLAVLTELLQSKKEEAGPGYWRKKATIINRVFIFFYITAVTLFLGTVVYHWTS